MVEHFAKARSLAEWLEYRYNMSRSSYPATDPRHGITAGGDEGDGFVGYYESYGATPLQHQYSCAANVYRGFLDAGEMWVSVGTAADRSDIVAHGQSLLATAPEMLSDIQASLAKTVFPTGNPRAPRGVPTGADPSEPPVGALGDFRGFPELMYAGVLSTTQADDLFRYLTYGNDSRLPTRPMTLGCTGYNNKQTTYTSYGMPYGLLQNDMVERFLLHCFGMSAHTYTRGTWTTPEAVHPDRDVGSTDYVAAGVHTAPTCLKWMLVFEEPNTRAVWLGKALPREWLAPEGAPVRVADAPTRYGRVFFTLSGHGGKNGPYSVQANLTLPSSFADPAGPPGGVVLRLRTPNAHVGRLTEVLVGGAPWTDVNATAETVTFEKNALTPALLARMQHIVASYTRL